MHVIGRLVAQRLVRTLPVVEGEIPGQADHQFTHRGIARRPDQEPLIS